MNMKSVLEGLLFLVGDEGIDMKDICDILENSRLYAPDFTEVNDADEGRFTFVGSQDEIVEEIRNTKEKLRICSFSLDKALTPSNLDLMWAHYRNSHCGMKIDFTLDSSYQENLFLSAL